MTEIWKLRLLSHLLCIISLANGVTCDEAHNNVYHEDSKEVLDYQRQNRLRYLKTLGPYSYPTLELERLANIFYLSASETEQLRRTDSQASLLMMRMKSKSFLNLENVTQTDSENFTKAADEIKNAIRANTVNFDAQVKDVFVTGINFDHEDQSETRPFHLINVVLKVTDSAGDLEKSLSSNFTKKGFGSENFSFHYLHMKPLQNVPRHTVYHMLLRLIDVTYIPQFENLVNPATLALANEVILPSRSLMRIKFGEFFFRVVILEFIPGPVLGDTIASMAFLLEQNEYNIVDIFWTWSNQAKNFHLGKHFINEESFVINEMNYVPEKFATFLKAEVTRKERTVNSTENFFKVGIPSFVAMICLILLVLMCAWEGWCCKRFIEGKRSTVCCGLGSNIIYENYLKKQEI